MPIYLTMRLKSHSARGLKNRWRDRRRGMTSATSKHKVPNVIFMNSLNCVSVKNNNLDKYCAGDLHRRRGCLVIHGGSQHRRQHSSDL